MLGGIIGRDKKTAMECEHGMGPSRRDKYSSSGVQETDLSPIQMRHKPRAPFLFSAFLSQEEKVVRCGRKTKENFLCVIKSC